MEIKTKFDIGDLVNFNDDGNFVAKIVDISWTELKGVQYRVTYKSPGFEPKSPWVYEADIDSRVAVIREK